MAKIVAEFDTVDKTLSVTVDGQEVENVEEAYMRKGYSDESKFVCSLMTCTDDKEGGMTTMTRLMASESAEVKNSKEKYPLAKGLSGFVELPALDVAHKDIEQYFAK